MQWICLFLLFSFAPCCADIPLFWWKEGGFVNFGDMLSLKLVERITNTPVRFYNKKPCHQEKKLLALGSIFFFAYDDDIVWGSGINGKTLHKKHYHFTNLDVRAVRGPLTRQFLLDHFDIEAPSIYGDPALLLPYLFPEFRKKEEPAFDYVIIPHYSEEKLFRQLSYENVVYPTEPWDQVIEKILNSKFVISSALHGVIVAEAFGIPARLLRISENESIFKYRDYYLGTNRSLFYPATSIEEALILGGEPPIQCDLVALYEAFPFDHWPRGSFKSAAELGIN